jgi:hypothetical protein
MTALSPYAQPIVEAGCAVGPLPKYLSDAFHALPLGDPRRHAAVLLAAEAYHAFCSPEQVAEDMERQVHKLRLTYMSDLLECYVAGADGAAAMSKDLSAATDWHELVRRMLAGERARVAGDAARAAMLDPAPRPGDHVGISE